MELSETTQLAKSLPVPQFVPGGEAKAISQSDRDSRKLEDVSKKFEGLLLHQMFKQAQQTTDQISDDNGEDEESSKDAGTEQYQSLFWTEMADVVSEQGGLGLWKTMYRQFQDRASELNVPSGKLDENL
jgi:Rod binding domain-containing protein